MFQKILTWSFYVLFFFTPLFFTKFNHELFEYNKMMLVYGLTVIIVTCWLFKMLEVRKFILASTPMDIPLVIFYLSQVLSTIFSIDPHTSIWGYYTRSNGGLLSITSYILLFYALVSNFDSQQAIKFLKSALYGGVFVALYAIPEHFGVSLSCVIMVHEFSAGCWVQDVQARVFATLGQPNWLAAYLGMLIFPAIYFFLTSKTRFQLIAYFLSLISLYLAFTFTFSRGGSLGLIAGLAVLAVLHFGRTKLLEIASLFTRKDVKVYSSSEERVEKYSAFKPFLIIILIFLFINVYFGSALTTFKLEKFSAPPRPSIVRSGGGTQLETGGTESGQIRFIVWRGALDIFKHYPIFGSGVETFAYSYYKFRPVAHNLVSEWDFLYNKAHNEYLNYLATTGVLGFISYMLIIVVFIGWCIKYYVSSIKGSQKSHNEYHIILILCFLASYASYLVQNFFGFSVVIIALFFFLFPGLVFLAAEQTQSSVLSDKKYLLGIPLFAGNFFHSLGLRISNLVYKRPIHQKLASVLLVVIPFYLLLTLVRFWQADADYKLGSDYEDADNISKSYQHLVKAVNLNKGEPLYRSDLGFIAAAAASGYLEKDATLSAQLKDDAIAQTDIALNLSPANVSLWRTAIRTYYQLASLDGSFEQKTVDILDKTISLAPTDPKLYYNKGLVLSQLGRNEEAVKSLKEAINLKSNYREARLTLALVYTDLKQKDLAKEQYDTVLKMVPNDGDAVKGLEDLKVK